MKTSMNQTNAWIVALALSGLVFGLGLFMVLRYGDHVQLESHRAKNLMDEDEYNEPMSNDYDSDSMEDDGVIRADDGFQGASRVKKKPIDGVIHQVQRAQIVGQS